MVDLNISPLGLARLAELVMNLEAVTAVAKTFDLVGSATFEQLVDLYPTYFLKVPSKLVYQDLFVGLNVDDLADDLVLH